MQCRCERERGLLASDFPCDDCVRVPEDTIEPATVGTGLGIFYSAFFGSVLYYYHFPATHRLIKELAQL